MPNVVALPSDVEAERTVLGAILLSGDIAEVALGSLSAQDFSDVDPRNKILFDAMRSVHSSGHPIDVTTLNNYLINAKLDKAAGGYAYLYELASTYLVPENIDFYINLIKEQAVLRDMLLKLREIEKTYAEGVENISDFILQSNDAITEIAQRRSVSGMRSAAEIVKIVAEKIAKKKEAHQSVTGINTGFAGINEHTHGWQKGDLIILAARPSVGKTALGLNFAMNAAKNTHNPVAFFSLEMSAELIMERLIASEAYVDSKKIQLGHLSNSDRLKINAAVSRIAETQLYIDDTPNSKLGDIIAKATKLKKTHQDLCLIVIDYLGRIRYSDRVDLSHQQQEVSYISGALKTLARSLNVPVLCLAQLNRDVETNDNKVPSLANLRDSGAIEQDADICMLLYREDYYTSVGQSVKRRGRKGDNGGQEEEAPQPGQTPEEKEKNGDISEVKVIIAKNRNGTVGTVGLFFQKAYSKFVDPTPGYMETLEQQASQDEYSDFE